MRETPPNSPPKLSLVILLRYSCYSKSLKEKAQKEEEWSKTVASDLVSESSNLTESEKDQDQATFCNMVSICANKHWSSWVKMTVEKICNSTSAPGGGFGRSKEHKAVNKFKSKSFQSPPTSQAAYHVAWKAHICLHFLSWQPMASCHYCNAQSFQPDVHIDTENIWHITY